jgi:hypothetical protein
MIQRMTRLYLTPRRRSLDARALLHPLLPVNLLITGLLK